MRPFIILVGTYQILILIIPNFKLSRVFHSWCILAALLQSWIYKKSRGRDLKMVLIVMVFCLILSWHLFSTITQVNSIIVNNQYFDWNLVLWALRSTRQRTQANLSRQISISHSTSRTISRCNKHLLQCFIYFLFSPWNDFEMAETVNDQAKLGQNLELLLEKARSLGHNKSV